jgi:hypothetical protein
VPSESMWAILQPDPMSKFRGQQRIMVSLEKGFGSREIWATVLSRDHLGETPDEDEYEEVITSFDIPMPPPLQ